jgi:hypothetical protein
MSISNSTDFSHLLEVKPFKFSPRLKAVVHQQVETDVNSYFKDVGFTLDWRKDQIPLIRLPKRLKPSPLELIFRPLLEPDSSILTSFSFPDFDAF